MLLGCVPALAEEAAAYTYTEENIFIDAGDHQIPATVTLPVGAEGQLFPAVIMLHGNGSTRHEAGNAYDYTAPEMAKAGIATIRFDYIGNGDSASDYIDFTYDKAVEDAMKCYEYLQGLGVIDMAHVGIMGWSQGGRLALLTAGRNDVFTTVLTWAGAYDQKGNEEEQYAIALEKGYFEVTYDWRAPLKQSPAYYECAMKIDYAAEVANIKAPILAIAGSLDNVVLPEVTEKIVAASTVEGSRTLILEGADHTFCVFTGDLTVLENLTLETIKWFNETL
ncbi:MAG: alpha/beta fold hydrolase [Clostridia bacterium]|nr:alpha/beta fold hydrolase [Clostridia bacterium]